MKKKLLVALLTAGCVMSMTACGETKTDDSEVNNTDVISTEAGTDAQEEDNAKVDDTEADDTETDVTETNNAEAENVKTDAAETNAEEAENVKTDAAETNAEEANNAEANNAEANNAEANNAETNSAEAGTTVRVNSEIGYSMTYDTTAFTFSNYDGQDVYEYKEIQEPIYVYVQKIADKDAQTLAEETAQLYEAEVSETNIAAGILAKIVTVTNEFNGTTEVHTFYAIPAGKDSLLMEVNSYVGASEISDSQIEEMLASFTVDAE